MKLFTLNASRAFGERVAQHLECRPAEHEEREFEDGEHKTRPLEPVRGQDVYVLQSLHGGTGQPVDQRLCRLLFLLGAVRDAGAARVTAVVPYLAYARKDRRTQPRDPVTSRYLAQLLEAMGIDAVMSLEVHNLAAFQNAFRCTSHALNTHRLFAEAVVARAGDGPVVIVSPDPGGVKRAQGLQEMVQRLSGREVGLGFVEKRRSGGLVRGNALVGDVAGASVWIVDDLISTGGTLLRAVEACQRQGARAIHALAAHGLFTGDPAPLLISPALNRVFITDTVPADRVPPGPLRQRVEVLSAAPLFAEAIRRLHTNGSLTDLLYGPA